MLMQFTTMNDGRSTCVLRLVKFPYKCFAVGSTNFQSTFTKKPNSTVNVSRYIGIWVDGVRVVLESRFLDVEDGPTSLRRVCHPQPAGGHGRVRHPSDYRGGVAEVWVGEPPPVAIGQSVSLSQSHTFC